MSGNSSTVNAGIGIGSAVAGLISWEYTHSLGWTILHIMGGWGYVVYKWAEGVVHW